MTAEHTPECLEAGKEAWEAWDRVRDKVREAREAREKCGCGK